MGNFYNPTQMQLIEDINILTLLFNIYIFPTKFILRLLHGIQIDIKKFFLDKKETQKSKP
jgi:hypothetical protein